MKSLRTVENSRALVELSETVIPRSLTKVDYFRPVSQKPIYSPATTPFRKRLIEEFINEVPEWLETEA
jgi:hypothetical protein